jgi:hypothetical protein
MSEKIIELIFGKRGSGKSYLARHRLKEFSRYLVYDTLGEYEEGVVFDNIPALAAFWKKVYAGNFRIIYQPLDPNAEFEQVCNLVWTCGNMAFMIEEIDCFCSNLTSSLDVAFKSIIQRGRHKDITLIGVTQRPFSIARLITSQAKKMCIFNTTEPRDIDYFKSVLGEQVTNKFEQLKQYEFVLWQDGVEELQTTKV